MKQLVLRGLLIISAGFLLQNCRHSETGKPRVVYVNSYHRGHPSSDEIMDAISEEFPADSFDLVPFIMDTKRNPTQDYIEKKAALLFDSIKMISPDAVIVSDDDAVKYIIQKYFPGTNIPVVFCGVNWSDKEYHFEGIRVTGMLEILPLADALFTIKSYYPETKKVLMLNENTTTSRKEMLLLDTLFERAGVTVKYQLVDDFGSWKTKFEEGNKIFDLIYVSTNGGVKGWDRDEAVNFVSRHILVPVVTCDDFMMPYVVLGITKVAREQGVWAAETAKKILKGEDPSGIPKTRNKQTRIWLNSGLAKKIGFQPAQELGDKATFYNN